MKQRTRKLAACIITLALLLTVCPMMGSASTGIDTAAFGEGDLLYTSESSANRAAWTGSQPVQVPEATSEATGSVVVSLSCVGCGSKADGMTIGFAITGTNGYFKSFDLAVNGSYSLSGLAPGEYEIVENKSGAEIYGYTLTSVTGDEPFTVIAGQTTNVPIVNNYEVDTTVDPVAPASNLTLRTQIIGGGPEAASLTLTISIIGPNGYRNTVTIIGEASTTLTGLVPGEYSFDVSSNGKGSFECFYDDTLTISEGRDAQDLFQYSFEAMAETTPAPDPVDIPENTPEESTPEVSSEPTPTPSESPEPTETPTPTPTATPEPTPTPTSEPIESGTPTPEPTATAEPAPIPTETSKPNVTVYIDDRDENIELPVGLLDEIENIDDAVEAVQTMADLLTKDQKTSHTAIDIATLYAERAASKTAVVEPDDEDEIWINAALLHRVDSTVKSAAETVRDELEDNGIDVDRKLPKTIILYVGDRRSFVAKVDPDVLTTDVDKVRVETDRFAITFNLEDLEPDLKEILRFKAEEVGPSGKSAGQTGAQPQLFVMATDKAAGNDSALAVQLTMPDGGITNPITLSLSAGYSENPYETMMLNGQAAPSKYNPVTITIDGKTTSSGTYTTDTNEVDFSDIFGKSEEMQEAIKNLASRGILVGTSENTFSPDESISRAEIATLLVRVLGLYDESAIPTYTDVTKADWYYVGAASSQRAKLMSGYGDNKFHGLDIISKEQIMAASGNVLIEYMDYEIPSNPDTYLKRYVDGVVDWGCHTIAVATQENLVIYRTDNKFLGTSDMTRGDAAIVINRLFRRIW